MASVRLPSVGTAPRSLLGLSVSSWSTPATTLRYEYPLMSRKRRAVRIDDGASWVFNEMAAVYDARPPYPATLVDAVVELAAPIGNRVLELGAGIGHFALALAERGLDVTATEPAQEMLERLRLAASARGLALHAVHAAAESLPFDAPAFDVALIVDAVHFVDAELAAAELRRVLIPGGALVVVTCQFAQTPFMDEVARLLESTSDRRPRNTRQAIRQLATLTDVRLTEERSYRDATPVDPTTLERILHSFSFVGPATSPEYLAGFCRGVHARFQQPAWARTFTLHAGRRRQRSAPWEPRPRTRGS